MTKKRNGRSSESGPEHIGDILKALLHQSGLTDQLQANRAVAIWDESVGPEIASHAHAISVERGTLWVGVDHPVRMHRLQMEEVSLKERINRSLLEENKTAEPVRQIRFRLAETA